MNSCFKRLHTLKCFLKFKNVFLFILNNNELMWFEHQEVVVLRTQWKICPNPDPGSQVPIPLKGSSPPTSNMFLPNNCYAYASQCNYIFFLLLFFTNIIASLFFCTLLYSLISISWDVNNFLLVFYRCLVFYCMNWMDNIVYYRTCTLLVDM